MGCLLVNSRGQGSSSTWVVRCLVDMCNNQRVCVCVLQLVRHPVVMSIVSIVVIVSFCEKVQDNICIKAGPYISTCRESDPNN